jgi:pSer/pThr/pTyr-binding forkhead associated (FHA) protein
MRASDRDREQAAGRRIHLPFARSGGAVGVALPAERTVVVGRGGECDVRLDDPTVPRRHVALRALDDAWVAIDLGSMNGTWLLGRRIGRARVQLGDELALGDCAVALEPPATLTALGSG